MSPPREYVIPDGYREIPIELTKPTIILTRTGAHPSDDYSSASLYRGVDGFWTWAIVSHDTLWPKETVSSEAVSVSMSAIGLRKIAGQSSIVPAETAMAVADPLKAGYLRIIGVSQHASPERTQLELEVILDWWRSARDEVRKMLAGRGEVFIRLEICGSHTFCNQTNDSDLAWSNPYERNQQLVLPGHRPIPIGYSVIISIDTMYWGRRCLPEHRAVSGEVRDLPWIFGGERCDWSSCNQPATCARFDFCGAGWIPCCAACAKTKVEKNFEGRGMRTQVRRTT